MHGSTPAQYTCNTYNIRNTCTSVHSSVCTVTHVLLYPICEADPVCVWCTCVSTGAVSLGSLLVFNSQPTATQMKMSLNEALDVAATTSPVIMLCMLDPANRNRNIYSGISGPHGWLANLFFIIITPVNIIIGGIFLGIIVVLGNARMCMLDQHRRGCEVQTEGNDMNVFKLKCLGIAC